MEITGSGHVMGPKESRMAHMGLREPGDPGAGRFYISVASFLK